MVRYVSGGHEAPGTPTKEIDMDDYWKQIEILEAMLRLHEPTTAQGVVDILREHDPQREGVGGDAFYSGANANHSLSGALAGAGWTVSTYEAHYAYTLRSPNGRDRLRYSEGDVYIA